MVSNNDMSKRSLEVCQNIQDVCHIYSKLKQVNDNLENTTVFTPHEDNNKKCVMTMKIQLLLMNLLKCSKILMIMESEMLIRKKKA